MSVQFYPNGIGGTAPGDQLDLARPLQTTGNVWYVSSLIGTNAASPRGQDRTKPLATLTQAQTNALDDDIIVLLAGHVDTSVGLSITKRLTIIGEGTASGKPSVSMSKTSFLTLSAANIELRNLWWPAATADPGTHRVSVVGVRSRFVGCYFELGEFDISGGAIGYGAAASDQGRIDGCTFISVGTLLTAQPFSGVLTNGVIADLEITNTVFSGGTVGFAQYAAMDLSAGAATRCKFTNLSLLLGADVRMGASATGYVNVALSTGGSRVSWG